MPWFFIECSDCEGNEVSGHVRAFTMEEARICVENDGYTIRSIRKQLVRSIAVRIWEFVDKILRPKKYDYLVQLQDLGVEIDRNELERRRAEARIKDQETLGTR